MASSGDETEFIEQAAGGFSLSPESADSFHAGSRS
jgi:hypothetical protein